MEEKHIDEERVKKWVQFHNFKGKFGAISTAWHYILSSLFFYIHIVPSKSSEEYSASGHTLEDAVRKKEEIQVQIEEKEKQEDEERVKHWAKTISRSKEQGENDDQVLFDFMKSVGCASNPSN